MDEQQWRELCTPTTVFIYPPRLKENCPVKVVDFQVHLETPEGLYVLDSIVGQHIVEIRGREQVIQTLISLAEERSFARYRDFLN